LGVHVVHKVVTYLICMCTLHVCSTCMHEHEQLKKKKIEFLTFCMSYVKIL